MSQSKNELNTILKRISDEHEKKLKRNKAKEFPLVKDILTIIKNSKITSIELSEA